MIGHLDGVLSPGTPGTLHEQHKGKNIGSQKETVSCSAYREEEDTMFVPSVNSNQQEPPTQSLLGPIHSACIFIFQSANRDQSSPVSPDSGTSCRISGPRVLHPKMATLIEPH